MVNTAREPRAYELMTILVPELAEEDLATQVQRISTHITTATGAIKETLTDSPWGRRRLAYSVRHNSQDYRDGYYIVFHFDLEPSRMTEIERELKLDVNVMRYLLVHDDPKAGEKDTSRPESADDSTESAATPADGPATTERSEATPAAGGSELPAPDAPAIAAEAPPAAAEAPPAAVGDETGRDSEQEPVATSAAPEAEAPEPLTAPSSESGPPMDETTREPEPETAEVESGGTATPSSPADPPASGDDAASETDATNDDAKQEG